MKGTPPPDQEKELKEKGGKDNDKSDSPKAKAEQDSEAKCRSAKPGKKKNDFEQGELYLKEKFENSIESLRLFKNDPLFFKPGESWLPPLTKLLVLKFPFSEGHVVACHPDGFQ